MSTPPTKAKRLTRKINIVTWSMLGFLMLGYMPTTYLNTPVVSMVAAAMAVIPYGMWLAAPIKAAVVGIILGLLSGAAAAQAMSAGLFIGSELLTYIVSPAIFCGLVAGLFGYMAQLRRRQLEQEWDKHE